jgi:hypothetical protein
MEIARHLLFVLIAAFATYITFELFPVLYGKSWIPFICLVIYFGLLETGYEWKRLRKNSN